MRGAVQRELAAGWLFSRVAPPRKRWIQAFFEDRNASVLANFGHLCYNGTPRGKIERSSFRSLLAKTLRRRKIAANVREHQHGTAFAADDAWTLELFRNQASLPAKGAKPFQSVGGADATSLRHP